MLAVSLLLLALAPADAVAADVKAQSSTEHLWHDDPFPDKTQGNFLQYVKIIAAKVDGFGRLFFRR